MKNSITAGLKFGEAVATLWAEWLKSGERRKFSKAIDTGEKFIRCYRRQGIYEKFSDKKREAYLDKLERLFFKYNN